MLLPQSAQYALRAMVTLAEHGRGGDSMSGETLATRARVPKAYASKIMRQLVAARLVEGRAGKRGGYRLIGDPRYVRIADILRAVGFFESTEHCVFGLPRCDSVHPCPLHEAWSSVKEAFLSWANTTSLSDVIGSAQPVTGARPRKRS